MYLSIWSNSALRVLCSSEDLMRFDVSWLRSWKQQAVVVTKSALQLIGSGPWRTSHSDASLQWRRAADVLSCMPGLGAVHVVLVNVGLLMLCNAWPAQLSGSNMRMLVGERAEAETAGGWQAVQEDSPGCFCWAA